MHTSDSTDRTPRVRSSLARLLTVLPIALTLIAIPAALPDAASAKSLRASEHIAMRQCIAAGGTVSWDFYSDGINADMTCRLSSGRAFFCVPVNGLFASIVDCIW